MIRWLALLALLLVVLNVPSSGSPGDHYAPQVGDGFHYYETVVLDDGTGNYSGYTENTFVNGSVGVTGLAANGTANASYQNTNSWRNNQGGSENWESSGKFGFSPSTFVYVNGTDNQTGYTSPVYVWFYVNNKLAAGGTFYLLNSEMSVISTNFSYDLGGSRYVETIYTEGTGSYQRDDDYGVFTATYTWQSYFDPGTGYIVGYLYTEHDSNGAGDGFTWTDTLYVTSTSYPLVAAAGPPPPPASTAPPFSTVGVIVAIVFVIVLIVIVVWLVARSRRNRPRQLPQHAAAGTIGYSAPPPPPFAPMGGAPPIHLTPSQQPVPQVVLRETVKVKCPYCGTLVDVTDKVCPNCGAPLST
jgi:hypothetical protein